MDVDAAGTAGPPPVQLPNQTISDEVLTLAGRGGGDGGDIEMGASPGTPVPISSRAISFGPQKGVSREQSKRVSREQSTGKGLWGKVARELSRISSQKTEKTSGSSMQEAEWDVFISYRVRADMKFVENLYWQLSSTEITDHASTRKLRVFWDKECLKTGEAWEVGFCRALCSSSLVVPVISRETFPRQDVSEINEDSPCDNVILELDLALALNELKGTAVMPLFVGDKEDLNSGQAVFTHYFESKCSPEFPEKKIKVTKIEEKKQEYLKDAKDALELQESNISSVKSRAVQEVFADITKFQGHFVQGPESTVVKAAVSAITACASRLVSKKTRASALLSFERTHTSGKEVAEWLASYKLAHYTSTLDRLRLDTLRKISDMTSDDVLKVHQTFLAQNADMMQGQSLDIANLGDRIILGSAVKALKGDKRTRTITDKAFFFKDQKVKGFTVLTAQNQLELVFAKKRYHFTLVAFFAWISLYNMYWALAYRDRQNYTPKTFSVTTYGAQISPDAGNWTDLPCIQSTGGACIFESSVLASQPDEIVQNLFDQPQLARYVKILPWTWSRMEETDKTGAGTIYAEMRVGIIGGSETGSLPFRVLAEGNPQDAWLQYGCNLNASNVEDPSLFEVSPDMRANVHGRWASKEDKIGEVQCCLTAPRVQVCTRDYCLSGDKDAAKTTWHEADALCQSRGWRLCTREELNVLGSSGCCSRLEGIDNCGYDNELVWTNTQGGLQKLNTDGRLNSDVALKNFTHVVLDLGKLQFIRGIQLQGGIPDNIFYGAACFSESWYWTFVFLGVGVFLGVFGWRSPRMGVLAGFGGGISFLATIVVARMIIFLSDPAVPSYYSTNPICPTVGVPRTFDRLSRLNTGLLLCSVFWILVQAIRPQRFWICFVCSFAALMALFGAVSWSFSGGGVFSITVIFWVMNKYAKTRARASMIQDKEKYDEEWKTAKFESEDCDADLQSIQDECEKANAIIKKGSKNFISSAGLLAQVSYWIGAIGIDRLSRRGKISWDGLGKIRQATKNIDDIFAEAEFVNESFRHGLVEAKIRSDFDHGFLVLDGPIKQTERAIQKVVRKYFRDDRCLTDLVRCVVIHKKISDVKHVLEQFLDKSVIGFNSSDDNARDNEKTDEMRPLVHGEEGGGGEWRNENSDSKYFRLCTIKDRFSHKAEIGYRDILLNLEVGWTINSESNQVMGAGVDFVPVERFEEKGIRTHVCEVQLMLESFNTLKVEKCHASFVKSRNLLSQ